MNELKIALKELGIQNAQVNVIRHDFASVDVYLNKKYFGIWDLVKKNFVA